MAEWIQLYRFCVSKGITAAMAKSLVEKYLREQEDSGKAQ